MHIVILAFNLSQIALAACGDDSTAVPGNDAGGDTLRPDAGQALDGAGDATSDAPADATSNDAALPERPGMDAQTDQGPQPDGTALASHVVTFAHGPSAAAMTLATINTDGTGYTKVPGFGTLDLFPFDMNQAAPAAQLTTITATVGVFSYLRDITLSPGCDHLVFEASYSNIFNLYGGSVATAGGITNLTGMTSNHYLHDNMGIPADNSQVVYFSGATTSSYQDAMMGRALLAPGKPQVIYKGAGAATYWILLGVK